MPGKMQPETKTIGQTLLDEIEHTQEEIASLRAFAETIGKLMKGETKSFLEVTTDLLGMLVNGTEETHRRIEELHRMIVDPKFTESLRRASNDN